MVKDEFNVDDLLSLLFENDKLRNVHMFLLNRGTTKDMCKFCKIF